MLVIRNINTKPQIKKKKHHHKKKKEPHISFSVNVHWIKLFGETIHNNMRNNTFCLKNALILHFL